MRAMVKRGYELRCDIPLMEETTQSYCEFMVTAPQYSHLAE